MRKKNYQKELRESIEQLIDNLVEYSNYLFEIEYDNNLEMPGLSILIIDNRHQLRNKIILNYNLIKNETISVIAHILAHEWGHHIYKHTYINPLTLNNKEKDIIEIEADNYAYNFIKIYNYNINEIINYIKNNYKMDCNILKKKKNFINKRLNILYNN
jgi:hypothetical protein